MPLNIKLSEEELKKLTPKEREKYEKYRKKMSPSKKPKHRDPGADDRMKKFEKSLREAGFNKGGYANCGASMKPAQGGSKKMYGGGYAKKTK